MLLQTCLCFLSILVIGSDGQAISTSIYYDAYGDESSVYYDGGRILVTCDTTICTVEGTMISLHGPQGQMIDMKMIDITKCNTTQQFVQLQISINEYTQLGEYTCQNNLNVTQTFQLTYRMCSDHQDQCLTNEDKSCVMGEEFKDAKFCIITTHQQNDTPLCRPGSVIDKTACPEKRNDHFCPIKVRSLCEAIQTEKYSDTWAQYGEECEEKDSTVHFKLGEHVLRFDQTFALPHRPNEQLQLVCPSKSVFSNPDSVSCTVKDKERPIELNITVACNKPIQFPHLQPDSGLGNFKLRCKLVKEAAMEPMIRDGLYHCKQIGERPKNFLLQRKYYTDEDGKEFEEKDATENLNLTKCHAHYVAKTCALQQKFERTVHTEINITRVIIPTPPDWATTPRGATDTPPGQIDPGATTSASRFKPEVIYLLITVTVIFLEAGWNEGAIVK